MKAAPIASLDLVEAKHTETLRRMCSEPEGEHCAPFGGSAIDSRRFEELIATAETENTAGTRYTFLIRNLTEAIGVGTLYGLEAELDPEIRIWIRRAHRGRGYGSFATESLLLLGFQTLRLHQLGLRVPEGDPAAQRIVERHGFQRARVQGLPGIPIESGPTSAPLYTLTRRQWVESRNRPFVAALHESLQPILAAELAAGNEVAEAGRGWPEPGSVFVRLRHQFRSCQPSLPTGVEYTRKIDNRWWEAEYSTRQPRHLLAY